MLNTEDVDGKPGSDEQSGSPLFSGSALFSMTYLSQFLEFMSICILYYYNSKLVSYRSFHFFSNSIAVLLIRVGLYPLKHQSQLQQTTFINRQRIHMKNQALFSLQDKSKKLKCLLQFLVGTLRVNADSEIISYSLR